MSYPASRTRNGIFILLRRLRKPLIVLLVVYAVAVLGFTLVPGVDPDGRPWTMSFLHAFYFVSFLGTTIGLGEIPFPFSDAQRLWATAAIYGTVVAWLYAIGGLFSVLQDPLFRRIADENSVERAVRRLRVPFYLICGYDDAGSRVARELSEDGARMVVIDTAATRVDSVEVDELTVAAPALCGDASDPKTLVLAGLTNGHCAGVLALTGDDFVNTKIALTARLLNPKVPVVCAARNHNAHARMAAAGADHILNPYDTFAERVALSVRTPSLHVIYEALTTQRGTAMDEPPQLPHGRWVLCGSGLFTRTLRRQLERVNISSVVIDPELSEDQLDDDHIKGDPTDPAVLREAGIDDASALVAGTAVDIDNLAMALAARNLNKTLFIVARQTQRRNGLIFRASPADLVMLSGYVLAAEVLRVIRAPQLATFLRAAREEEESWSADLLLHMREVIGKDIVESWSIGITPFQARTACTALAQGQAVTLRQLMTYADGSGELVHAIPLLLQRQNERLLRPDLDTALQLEDRILYCGRSSARTSMRHNLTGHTLPLMSQQPPQVPERAPRRRPL